MALTDSLLHYWKLDEASGNATDEVGGYTLTNSGLTYGTGKINNGAVYDAGTDHLYNGSPTDLNFTGAAAFSFSCWVKCSSLTAAPVVLSHIKSTANFEGYILQINSSGGIIFDIGQDNGGTNLLYLTVANGTITTGSWFHIVLTYDGSKTPGGVHIYVNNVDKSLTTVFNSFSGSSAYTGNFEVGNREGNTINFSGTLDELGAWSRVLTSGEVSSLYNGGSGLAYPLTVAGNNAGFFALRQRG